MNVSKCATESDDSVVLCEFMEFGVNGDFHQDGGKWLVALQCPLCVLCSAFMQSMLGSLASMSCLMTVHISATPLIILRCTIGWNSEHFVYSYMRDDCKCLFRYMKNG